MNFDNVTIIIVGLIVVSVLSLIYGNQEILLMVVGGLLGFLAKDKATVVVPDVTAKTETKVENDVGSEDDDSQ